MFDNLSDKLQRVFKNLRGEGKLSAENMESALREIRVALLEADVNFRVVKQLIENIKLKAMGGEVLSPSPLPSWGGSRNFPETISFRSAPICELTWPG
jgi:signal recognition particle GTPase